MLDSKQIINAAKNQTNLEYFGNPLFLEGFECLVQSINEEADLNYIGMEAQQHRLIGILANLLRIENACIQHPEILTEEIKSPVVIVGLPRTGSTMTHRLLASDPRHTAMLWWEGRYPAMLDNEVRGHPNERMEMGKAEVEAVMQASPEALTIHPWDYNGADEEILLLEHTFLSTVPESFMRLPTYSKWVESQDHIHAYAQLKIMLQYLQWQNPGRGKKRWVLKSPHHLGFIDKLLKIFPDSKVIQTHRDPLKTVPSFCSMCSNLFEPLTNSYNKNAIGHHWAHKLAKVLNHCMEVSNSNKENFLNLEFQKMIKDPILEMEQVYKFIDEDFTDQAENAMNAWKEENQHEMGAHQYSLEEFGLESSFIDSYFSEYINQYIR
ncbi:sulfotransferase domain protein [SAR86 cluster bacterium SAR86E]|uniref:Sulfotransferase domain protein n=1 Tax=SAR86 cluster bacterium SAR86E TaxID=1208365 RepID=K6GJS8_9GAMM|nr:sulfotransferase domain protein [SAR86 cluster bacterium SAR86E]